MKLKSIAITGASTVSFAFLVWIFSILSAGAVYSWTSTSVDNSFYRIVGTLIAIITILATLSIVVTGILQIRRPQPRLAKLTIYVALGCPLIMFAVYAATLMGIGIMTDFSLAYSTDITLDLLRIMTIIFVMIGIALILPSIRNGVFCSPQS